ncbi:hypothetical protein [Pseudoduganella sp. R-34]|uniref:hypothetical protein n=1 Tax=unclassified Pseudoduganella TaxID=2637179 RepID=UPI003CF2AB5E
MKIHASLFALTFAVAMTSPALACQPPRDMPSDPEAARAYWERAQTQWEKRVIASAPTLVVATTAEIPGSQFPEPGTRVTVKVAPIKLLRGFFEKNEVGGMLNHFCDDFKVWVTHDRPYLLAMNQGAILLAVPLKQGDEQAGVRDFFKRIDEPNPWE